MAKFFLYQSCTAHYIYKKYQFHPSFIHKNFYGLHSFYLFIFCFGEMVNLNLMFAKNMIVNLFNDSDLDPVLKLDLYTCKRN